MNQVTIYTSHSLWDLTRISSDLPFNIIMQLKGDSSVNEFFLTPMYTAPFTLWRMKNVPLPDVMPESVQEDFIGMLSTEEAEKMMSELSLFKKRFDEDFNKRNKILFGE